MHLTKRVTQILSNYQGEPKAVRKNLARILIHGKLGGTGRMIILPVDQGFEHGPARSFGMNPAAYDPAYFFNLAIKAGLSAYAAPYGALNVVADKFEGQIPLIMKMNSANSLSDIKDQAVTGTVDAAVKLGCSAIGFTIYPGSDYAYGQYEELRDLSAEAKAKGLAVVVWSYPRGPKLSTAGETALDVVGYGAHMAALLGADIIKVKLPSAHLEQEEAKKVYEAQNIARDTLTDRVRHIVDCCFAGRRLVVFSGGATKGTDDVLIETKAIHAAGGNGSIIGRNAFQRPEAEALDLLGKMVAIYKA